MYSRLRGVTFYRLYLSDHDGEGEDSNKVVDELENNLKQGGGVGQTTNGDQGLHRKVVAANITAQSQMQSELEKDGTKKNSQITMKGCTFSREKINCQLSYVLCVCITPTNLLPLPLYTHLVDPSPLKAEPQ